MRRWKTIGLFILAAAVISAAGYFGFRGNSTSTEPVIEEPPTVPVTRGDVQQAVSAPGQLVGTLQTDLKMGISGQLTEIKVKPGDRVKKGQEIARAGNEEKFKSAEAAARLNLLKAQQEQEDVKASASKETADAHLALIKAQDAVTQAGQYVQALKFPRASDERLEKVNSEYQAALQDVAVAQDYFDKVALLPYDDPRRIEELRTLTTAQTNKDQLLATLNWLTGKPTKKDLDEADTKLEQAKADLEKAELQWKRVKNGPDAMKMELADAKVSDMQALYDQAKKDLENTRLKAPFDGVIIDVKAKAGDDITPTTVIASLSDPSALEALVTVVEEDYQLVHPGLTAGLFFDAQPEAEVSGEVARVVPNRASSDKPLYPVYLKVNQPPEGLVPGMTLDASIIIEERKDVLVLPKALVRARGDGSASVEVWANLHKEKREIQIGLIGDQNVEVVSGLQEGELVVGK